MRATYKIKQIETCKRLLKIEVPQEELALLYTEVYSQIQKEVTLPGFRKGKAPIDLIKENYKEYAKKKVLELAVEDSYKQAMKEAGFSTVGLPHIENVKFPESGNLSFDATVEIKPEVNVKNYKGLKIKKKTNEVKDLDIDTALENLRQFGAQYKTVNPRPVKEGDYLVCDMEWFVNGGPIDKKEAAILPIEKKALTEELFGGILGSTVGDKKSVSINIGKDFPKQEYVGKLGTLEILIHEIKQKELPALDDEFAKDLGVSGGVEELKNRIKARLALEKEEAVRLDMQNQAIEQLLKTHSFELPKSLVEAEIKNLIEDARHKLLQQGYTEGQVKDILEKEKDNLNKRFTDHAEKQVKAFFILEDIAEKENLNVTESEVDQFISALADRQKQKDLAGFRRQLEKEDKINAIHWQLTEAKVMGFLLNNAKVEEWNETRDE